MNPKAMFVMPSYSVTMRVWGCSKLLWADEERRIKISDGLNFPGLSEESQRRPRFRSS